MTATAAQTARTRRLAAEWRWLVARRDLRAQASNTPLRDRQRAAAAVANARNDLARVWRETAGVAASAM